MTIETDVQDVANDLSTHERVCAQRYINIDDKLEAMDLKIDDKFVTMEKAINELKESISWMTKGIIGGAVVIVLERLLI